MTILMDWNPDSKVRCKDNQLFIRPPSEIPHIGRQHGQDDDKYAHQAEYGLQVTRDGKKLYLNFPVDEISRFINREIQI